VDCHDDDHYAHDSIPGPSPTPHTETSTETHAQAAAHAPPEPDQSARPGATGARNTGSESVSGSGTPLASVVVTPRRGHSCIFAFSVTARFHILRYDVDLARHAGVHAP